jgi:hypothetical protein
LPIRLTTPKRRTISYMLFDNLNRYCVLSNFKGVLFGTTWDKNSHLFCFLTIVIIIMSWQNSSRELLQRLMNQAEYDR